jgi:RNA polymerase sigma-70 factor, ECF subfamily
MNTLLSAFPWTELRRFVQRKVRDPQQVDDLVQEVAITVMTKGESLRDPGAFKAWVFSIARRKVVDSYRARQRERTALNRYAETRRATDDRPDPTERFTAVKTALREIPGHFARVLILRYFYGLSYRNIGKTLHGTEVGVRCLAHRARKALQSQLAAVAA